jgi:hypothetical protein
MLIRLKASFAAAAALPVPVEWRSRSLDTTFGRGSAFKPADEEGGGADRYAEGAEGVKRKESFLLSALYAINAVNESVPSLPDCIGNPLRHWTVPATRQLG